MFFKATNELVVGGKPIFLGVIKEGFFDPTAGEFTDALPLIRDEVQSMTYSVFKLGARQTGSSSIGFGMNPVDNFQNVAIPLTSIKPFDFVPDWVYEKIKEKKFKVNFSFVPDNVPPIFETAGTYQIRFEVTDIKGEIHPAVLEINVR
ncbi:MAG: hypothetical protein FWC43_04790 [Planctomycetaceae bacterium]|nr:hypothetical protein [Planctomycetaceae bacterium]